MKLKLRCKVENLVKYVKNNYFLPRLEFTDFNALNSELSKKCCQRLENGKYQKELWRKRLLDEDFLPFDELYHYARIDYIMT